MKTCTPQQAAQFVKSDLIVCFPTETLFGLAVNPFSEIAVEKLLSLKDRDRGKGISLIIDKAERIEELPLIEDEALSAQRRTLQEAHWPGPLTLVVAVERGRFPLSVDLLGPDDSIALRLSSHPLARELAQLCGGFITATSANLRAEVPLISSEGIDEIFPGMPILHGECMDSRLESTILDIRTMPPRVLRHGAVLFEE